MKIIRKIIEIDEELCDGCGQCVIACAEGAIQIINGKAKLISEKYCDGLGACIGECPRGAIKIVEREAEEFDEEAVEEYLKKKPKEELACGCPSTQVQILNSRQLEHESLDMASSLEHWPVQIRLIPPDAPFLKNARLLVVADCVPVAYPLLHQRFLKDRVIMIGCPKFDNVEEYINRFANIFKLNNIKKVTTLIMEVPCCSALPVIVKKGMEKAGVDLEFEQFIVSIKGELYFKRVV